MILRSPFIRLKTNNAASQPTRTRVPVNSFLSFLGKGGSRVLRASTYRRLLLPTPPVMLVTNFPPRELPTVPVKMGAQRGPTGQWLQPPQQSSWHTTSFINSPNSILKAARAFCTPSSLWNALGLPEIITEHSHSSAHHTPLLWGLTALWDRKVGFFSGGGCFLVRGQFTIFLTALFFEQKAKVLS